MITVEVWLYGPLARFAGDQSRGSHAHLFLEFPEGARMADLLERLGMPLEEKGITFVNAQLTDMPGLAADLDRELQQNDRVAFFHRRSMWPFQYRHGANLSPRLQEALNRSEGGALHHSTAVRSGMAGQQGGREEGQ